MDGFMAPADKSKIQISNEYSQTLIHKWRSEEAAIMVGTETALHDNPQLNARLWNDRHPIRIVTDRTLRLPASLNLFDRSVRTVVFTEIEKSSSENLEFITIDFKEKAIKKICHHLSQMQVQSVLVEGGSMLLQSFIDANLWDEARVFISPKLLKAGIHSPKLGGSLSDTEQIDADQLIIMENIA